MLVKDSHLKDYDRIIVLKLPSRPTYGDSHTRIIYICSCIISYHSFDTYCSVSVRLSYTCDRGHVPFRLYAYLGSYSRNLLQFEFTINGCTDRVCNVRLPYLYSIVSAYRVLKHFQLTIIKPIILVIVFIIGCCKPLDVFVVYYCIFNEMFEFIIGKMKSFIVFMTCYCPYFWFWFFVWLISTDKVCSIFIVWDTFFPIACYTRICITTYRV